MMLLVISYEKLTKVAFKLLVGNIVKSLDLFYLVLTKIKNKKLMILKPFLVKINNKTNRKLFDIGVKPQKWPIFLIMTSTAFLPNQCNLSVLSIYWSRII